MANSPLGVVFRPKFAKEERHAAFPHTESQHSMYYLNGRPRNIFADSRSIIITTLESMNRNDVQRTLYGVSANDLTVFISKKDNDNETTVRTHEIHSGNTRQFTCHKVDIDECLRKCLN